uniref:DUF4760 domain-containing protein n=1 Tax=Trichocoleus desertorum TaxID=1481672 RepID=UPI0025B395DD|nr:hypothetical protein [Trichocoleus desertorum]
MTLDDARNLAIIAGTFIAACTLVKAVREYARDNAQKRAEQYSELRKQFKENERFQELLEKLDKDDPSLEGLPYAEKTDFLGFYEDIALAVNSGLLKKEVVHYMFGYYAIRCWKSQNFWSNLERNSHYWALFKHFALEMIAVEEKFKVEPPQVKSFRF